MTRSVLAGARWALALSIPFLVSCAPEGGRESPEAPDVPIPPVDVVRAAAEAMGGEALLRGLRSLRVEGFVVDRGVGVAESPTAAPLILHEFAELRDLEGARTLDRSTYRVPMSPEPIPVTRVLRADSGTTEEREALLLSPERIVLRALDAPDLVARPDTTFDGRTARVVEFGADPIRLYVDAETALPLGWSTVHPYPDARFTWDTWGEVESRMTFFQWSREPGGLRYPYGQHLERNGIPLRWISITRVEADAAIAPDSFPAPEPRPAAPAEPPEVAEVAPGVVFLPGTFNVVAVRQPDGVVILEAPESAERSREVIAELERRFPGTRPKAVVATGRVWPHLAGLAPYVARGVPVYASPDAEATVRAMLMANGQPDPDLRIVGTRDSIGSGANRVVLWSPAIVGAPRASRALVAQVPGSGVLYVGDLLIPERFEPNFWLAGRHEVARVLEGLERAPRTVIALHDPPMEAAVFQEELAGVD